MCIRDSSSINNEELLKSPVASMANALTGKVTGLASVQSSGQPGACLLYTSRCV